MFSKTISFLQFVIFHLLVTGLTSVIFMCTFVYVHRRVLLKCTMFNCIWNSSTHSHRKENGVHPFGSVGFIVMMGKRIMGLRLNKGREFYVGITALLLFPRDLLQHRSCCAFIKLQKL